LAIAFAEELGAHHIHLQDMATFDCTGMELCARQVSLLNGKKQLGFYEKF
jgi:hypothetical protein